jgi:hypothetical protein
MFKKLVIVSFVVAAAGLFVMAGDKTKHMKKESAVSSMSVTKETVTIVTGQIETPEVIKAMNEAGFKVVNDVPAANEKVRLVNKTFDGKKYIAIEYYGGGRGVVTAASKFEGTRLEEMLLVLNGKLDYPVFSDKWLKPINQGILVGQNPNFEYGKLGKNPKVDKVAELKDGRIVYHVTQEGIAPYFAVETIKKDVEEREIKITDYAETMGCGNSGPFQFRADEQILKDQALPADAKIKVLKTHKEKIGECYLVSRELRITYNVEKTTKALTSYPYDE